MCGNNTTIPQRTPIWDKKIIIADLETTGFDPEEHEIIEFGAVVYDHREDRVVEEWEKKVAPSHIETASKEALRINGYANNPDLYGGNLKSALYKFNSLAKDCVIMGQNIRFDIKFLTKNMSDFGIVPSWDKRIELELSSICWFPVYNKTTGVSLEKFCNHFNISNTGSHSALMDCRRALEVYRSVAKLNNVIQ